MLSIIYFRSIFIILLLLSGSKKTLAFSGIFQISFILELPRLPLTVQVYEGDLEVNLFTTDLCLYRRHLNLFPENHFLKSSESKTICLVAECISVTLFFLCPAVSETQECLPNSGCVSDLLLSHTAPSGKHTVHCVAILWLHRHI